MFYEIEEYISVKLSFQSNLWALGWRRFGSDAFNLLGAFDQNSVFEMGLINYNHTPKTQAYERGWRRQCPAHSPNNQQVGNLIRYVSRLVGLGPPRSQRGDRAYSIKAINKSYLALKQKSAA